VAHGDHANAVGMGLLAWHRFGAGQSAGVEVENLSAC
jgi:hypothetical protein